MLCTASDTFWIILAYSTLCFSGMRRHIRSYSALLRHIHSYWDIIKTYSGLFRHSAPCVILAYSQPYHILSPLAYLEPEAYLKPCGTLTRHIQNRAIGHYSAIFRHIQNLVQCFFMQKPGILGILEYSEPFHNYIPTHI